MVNFRKLKSKKQNRSQLNQLRYSEDYPNQKELMICIQVKLKYSKMV